ncbi:VCBS repeat-containing protein [Flavivirga algicola]|uniref:VCBS repeat-containing protein n=1 Tax=Flavivirga algicola TaxID=2729136 RepID=A0ABX1S0D1_9FLAO|nr:VCBS repeat-containing protein [Flavivirga algicola]NMH89310.1 VCBS repeat-containing protein [Flavivirga algicola]
MKGLSISIEAKILLFTSMCFIITLYSCKSDKNEDTVIPQNTQGSHPKLFSHVNASDSGINFINLLTETENYNYFKYSYSYLGGGVASADFNNDGLQDLFFISNSNQNTLYLNKGNFKFEDITASTGINPTDGFNTGVTVVDINQDGFLDIYISRGGHLEDNNKFANLLYLNNGDLTFTEKAKEHGLDDSNRTIQATFFDYDNDNDLDVYLSNTPNVTAKSKIIDLEKIGNDPKTLSLKGSDRLYENDGTGHFKDVTKKAGIGYDVGFGLNPQIGDINNDGWLDIYVCNDFNMPDFVYINNGNGTFKEQRDVTFKHMSFNSMGSDFSDINNDGYFDLITLDMNPEDYVRSKTTMAMTSVGRFEKMVKSGYHYQYMHNMLQINNGNGTYREISKLSGIADTDWSWAVLSADFDLDGLNDIYITNGVFRDVMDRDTHNTTLKILRKNRRKPTNNDFLQFTKMMPQQKLVNYIYKNNGNLTFSNVSNQWVESYPTFSNGVVYSDLDNDGDLDIVTNNINDKATVLKNNTIEQNKGQYLKVKFKGPKNNVNGLGAKVKLYQDNGTIQTRQLINTRGFLSSVSNILHFGLPKNTSIKKLEVQWLDGKHQTIENIKPNTLLDISYESSINGINSSETKINKIFSKLTANYKHKDPYFNDYDLQVLLPHKLSQTGPALAKGDVNNDGIDDIYIGGGRDQSGQLLIGKSNGAFHTKSIADFSNDKSYEDQSAAFFDVDNDGDQDLYVVSGSYELYNTPKLMQDRLYINDGSGRFTTARKNALPEFTSSGSVVVPSDFDNDGDVDLFIGGRVIPGKYPNAPTSTLLINEKGIFTIKTKEIAPELEHIGMVTSAAWDDINNDNKLDLILSGEWMGIEVFINQNNKLIKSDRHKNLSETVGWWNKLLVVDVDNDGDNDIIAGNLGLNYKFHASKEKPFQIYSTDFDSNGTEDVILAKEYNGKEVPVRGKTCMTQQIPHLAQKISNYNDFANRNLEGILGEQINNALNYKATEFRSGIFINNGISGFTFSAFENTVQQSPINSMVYYDINNDGVKDLILAGNNYQSEVETTRADAGIGNILLGKKDGSFESMPHLKSGFFADKDVRHMELIEMGDEKIIFVANNNNYHSLFKINKP